MKSGPLGTRPLARLFAPLLALTALGVGAVVAFGVTAPTASFTRAPTGQVAPNELVSFDASASDDPETPDELTYSWDLDGNETFGDATTENPTHTYTTAGTYDVQLKVTDPDSNEDTTTDHVITVNTDPAASFTGHTSPRPTHQNFTFTDNSTDADTGQTLTRAWDLDGNATVDFNDGSAAAPTKSFPNNGVYPIRLRVTDSLGGETVVEHNVTVTNQAPTANISGLPTNPQQGTAATYNGSGTDPDGTVEDYQWEFVDGDPSGDNDFDDSTAQNPSFMFNDNGLKTVRLRVKDDDDATSATDTETVYINAKPTASFTHGTPSQAAGTPTSFNGAFTDPDTSEPQGDSITSWSWVFKQGATTIGTRNIENPTFQFTDSGSYTVELTVTDSRGGTDVESQTVVVTNALPTAGFTVSDTTPQVGQSITFDGNGPGNPQSSDSDGTVTGYAWDLDNDGDFDDGTGATSPAHSFSTNGSKDVRLQVTDDDGGVDTVTQSVYVNGAPTASFTHAAPVQGSPTTFNGDFDDPDAGESIATWQWTFKEGDATGDTIGTRTGQNPSFTFANYGTYTILLAITDSRGGTDTDTQTIVVDNRAPIASFNFFPTAPLAGDTVNFTSTSSDPDGPLAGQAWDLDGDGVYDDAGGVTAATVFPSAGTFNVALSAQDQDGAFGFVLDTVTVGARPAAAAPLAAPPAAKTAPAAPQLIRPFPIVRIRGRLVRGGGTRITVLTAEVPKGTTVLLRCKGNKTKGCPFAQKQKKARTSAVNFRELKRTLRAGAVIELFIEKSGAVGKYTRFKIRRGRAPLRKDACLMPGSKRPRPCPG